MDTVILIAIAWAFIAICAKLWSAAYGREAYYAKLEQSWKANAERLGIKGIDTIPIQVVDMGKGTARVITKSSRPSFSTAPH